MSLFAREARLRRAEHLDRTFTDADRVADLLGDVDVPADIAAWMGRLHALIGVPFDYLVPDEDMLPPESIRFFRLDDNWVRALLDGAFSLGRNLAPGAGAASTNVDRGVIDALVTAARVAAPRRQRSLAEAAPIAELDDAPKPWTGFLLRSRVVAEYPGLGVNVYPQGGTPQPGRTPVLLPVRRLDRLGEGTDTLLCLVEGDAFRVDVHEAPELLHYGLETYTPGAAGAPPQATKELRTFTRAADGAVSFGATVDVPVGSAFRAASPRVVDFTALAALLQAHNGSGAPPLDSAQMGFAMTQGVGMVSFERETSR